MPDAVVDLIRTAYPTAQGAVQELLDAVYSCLRFVGSPDDAAFWGTGNRNPPSEDSAGLVAAAILSAAQVATGGNSAPALLSYLDAEDVGVYVLNIMAKKEEENKRAFFAQMDTTTATLTDSKLDTEPDTSTDSTIDSKDDIKHDAKDDTSAMLENFWVNARPSVRFGKYDPSKPSDLTYFKSLAPWEQRWVKNHRIGTAYIFFPVCSWWPLVYYGANEGRVPEGSTWVEALLIV